jgi:hypothetical protein
MHKHIQERTWNGMLRQPREGQPPYAATGDSPTIRPPMLEGFGSCD